MNKPALLSRMNGYILRRVATTLVALVVIGVCLVPASAGAATGWQVSAGAETPDMAIQLAYYFAHAITVNAGDTVTWNFQSGEPHSVNFIAGTGSGGPVDTGLQAKGAPPFSLTFSKTGDYNYICDIHPHMVGVVHVQAAGSAYPHNQAYYDRQSREQREQLFDEGRHLRDKGLDAASDGAHGDTNTGITAGIGATHATGSVIVMRFLKTNQHIKVGDTVTWSNRDPETPHTITMNLDYSDPFAALIPVGRDAAGPPGHATISSTAQPVNAGFLWAAPFPGLPPIAYVGTTFQAKFTKPGTYRYFCELHDSIGMVGTITVEP